MPRKKKTPLERRTWVQAMKVTSCFRPSGAEIPDIVVDSPGAAINVARMILSDQSDLVPTFEAALALFLNARNRLLAYWIIEGTVDHASVYPREVIHRALMSGAVSIIFLHNHPSGQPEPSPQDIALTRRIVEALVSVDMQLHDHIVFAVDRTGTVKHSSLREMGLMPPKPIPHPPTP